MVDTRQEVITKPHGHGDVHFLLHQSGLLRQWQSVGIEWLVFFQDNNPLYLNAVPPALGVRWTIIYHTIIHS